jgi:hypothetical protein
MSTPPSEPPPAPGPEGQSPYPPPAPYGAVPPGQPAYGSYGPGYGSYGRFPASAPPPPAPPSKAMAIWALVLGWIPCAIGFVVAVVLAIVVLVRSGDGRPHGKGLAIAGLVGVAFWVMVVVAVFVISPFGVKRDSAGHVTRAGNVSVGDLRVGDCGPDPGNGVTKTLRVVPCSSPHTFEVLGVFDLPDGAYPGAAEVHRLARRGCISRARQVPQVQGRGDLSLRDFHPTEATWDRFRTVVCLLATTTPASGSIMAP